MCDLRNCMNLGHHTTVELEGKDGSKVRMEVCDFHCDNFLKSKEVLET